MPLYEYQCSKCEKVHEIVQKFSDAPLDQCPECGGPVSKLISMSSFSLKGGGWYTTDYKKSGPSKTAESAPTTGTTSTVAPTPAAVGDKPKSS
jgi:putative FmdB family regulatory protein